MARRVKVRAAILHCADPCCLAHALPVATCGVGDTISAAGSAYGFQGSDVAFHDEVVRHGPGSPGRWRLRFTTTTTGPQPFPALTPQLVRSTRLLPSPVVRGIELSLTISTRTVMVPPPRRASPTTSPILWVPAAHPLHTPHRRHSPLLLPPSPRPQPNV